MNDVTYILVGGFHGSGSSAVVDLLKEYEGFYDCGAEIRTICDPYGIKNLEQVLVDDWDWINASAAISDFLDLAKKCSRQGGGRNLFSRFGLNYSKTINSKFMEITYRYVNKLTDFTYTRDFYYHKAKKKYWKYVFDRCRFAAEYYTHGKLKWANRKQISYFSKPTREQFSKATQEYFDELFADIIKQKNIKYVILDLAIAPRDALLMYRYFRKAKMIIVERDPRDILANLLKRGTYCEDWETKEGGGNFVMWQKAMRDGIPEDKNIMTVHFEDVVLNTNQTVHELANFIGFDESKHEYPNEFFRPEISSKNIGYWQDYMESNKDAMEVIIREMNQYFYDNNSRK